MWDLMKSLSVYNLHHFQVIGKGDLLHFLLSHITSFISKSLPGIQGFKD